MIKYTLICEQAHDFEGWFGNSDDYESQQKRHLVNCPFCGSSKVEKALMTPSVSTSRPADKFQVAKPDRAQRKFMREMRVFRDKITSNAENVGDKFPEEARKIHYGEVAERGIYGAASLEEVRDLVDEGVQIAPLPVLPEDIN